MRSVNMPKCHIICKLRKNIRICQITSSKLYASFRTFFQTIHYKQMRDDDIDRLFFKLICQSVKQTPQPLIIRFQLYFFRFHLRIKYLFQPFLTWKRYGQNDRLLRFSLNLNVSFSTSADFPASILPFWNHRLWCSHHDDSMLHRKRCRRHKTIRVIMIARNHNRKSSASV